MRLVSQIYIRMYSQVLPFSISASHCLDQVVAGYSGLENWFGGRMCRMFGGKNLMSSLWSWRSGEWGSNLSLRR